MSISINWVRGMSLLLALACGRSGLAAEVSAPFEWQEAKPADEGMSAQRLEAARVALAAHGTSGLLVIRHDRIVCEWYAGKVQTLDKPHGTASLAKALVGGMSLAETMNDDKLH